MYSNNISINIITVHIRYIIFLIDHIIQIIISADTIKQLLYSNFVAQNPLN